MGFTLTEKEKVCSLCGHVGKPKHQLKGSVLIELILWLVMILPGLIYSLWRWSTKHETCRSCGSVTLLPADSPRGRRIIEERR
jgi:rRNA maturation endonuclease Nob1